MLACFHTYPTLHSRRFGIPAEHCHKSFVTNSMIRLSISNLLCGRNAAPPTIANWHAEACFHADEEAMMVGLYHSLIRDDSDRFAVTLFVRFVRFVFARKKRVLTPSNLNFFSS